MFSKAPEDFNMMQEIKLTLFTREVTKSQTIKYKIINQLTTRDQYDSFWQDMKFVLRHDNPVGAKLKADIRNSIDHWIVCDGIQKYS